MRGWTGLEWMEMSRRMRTSSHDGGTYLSAYPPPAPPRMTAHVNPCLRALEGIKDRLQSLSDISATPGHTDNEGDMITACEIADDLRDAIVEYQVGANAEKRVSDSSFM